METQLSPIRLQLTPVGKFNFTEDKDVNTSQEHNSLSIRIEYPNQYISKTLLSPKLNKREMYKDNDSSPSLTKKSSPEKETKSQIDDKSENSTSADTKLIGKRKRCPLIEGSNSIENYYHLNKIHEGVYGVVFRARDKFTGEIYAIKKVKLSKEKDGFPLTSIREINLLLSLKHQNIVNVREVVIGSSLDKIYVVMEYIEHELRDLMENIKYTFKISEIKCLMKQLIQAIEYLHSRSIIHRDLKTSNILYSNKGILKVCDFGLARKYVGEKPYTPTVVTLWYRAPEILLGNDKYTPAIDMWSVGCIFAELILKEPFLMGQKEGEQIDLIFRTLGTPTNSSWPGWRELKLAKNLPFKNYIGKKLREKFTNALGECPLTDNGLDLLEKMLLYDPAKRMTASDALKHPWFKESPPCQELDLMPTFPPMNEIPRELRKQKTFS